MRSHRRHLALAVLATLTLAVGACGDVTTATPTPAPIGSPSDSVGSEPPAPTEVPGGASSEPEPVPTAVTTTETAWGTILDAVPDSFPVFPGARVAEPPPEPVSAAYISEGAGVDTVATWYRDALEALGFATMDLSSPLEDGSRVLDSQGDLPECRIQVTFRPAGGSTMITVLYAAGCAGGEG